MTEARPTDPTRPSATALTTEQLELGQFFVTECGLQDVAERTLTMYGESGTVLQGLARCAHLIESSPHMAHMTPQDIGDFIRILLQKQATSPVQESQP